MYVYTQHEVAMLEALSQGIALELCEQQHTALYRYMLHLNTDLDDYRMQRYVNLSGTTITKVWRA